MFNKWAHIAIIAVLMFCIFPVIYSSASWDERKAEFINLYASGDAQAALTSIQAAIVVEQEKYGKDDPQLVVSALDLAELYAIAQDKESEKITYFRQAIAIYKRMLGNESSVVARLYSDLGSFYANNLVAIEAEHCYKEALKIYRKDPVVSKKKIAHTLDRLAELYYSTGNYSEAVTAYQELVSLYEYIYGKNSTEMILPLDRLYELYFINKDFKNAEDVTKKEQDIYQQDKIGDNQYMIKPYVRRGDIAYAQNKRLEAASFYKKAMGLVKNIYGNEAPYLDTLAARLSAAQKSG